MRRRYGPTLAAAVLLGAGLGMSGSGAIGAEAGSCPDVSPQETLTVAMDGDIETIDPMFSHFQKANEINYNIYDQFFRYGTAPSEETGTETYDTSEILGSSVESWEMSEDGRSITLDIRDGMTFHHTGNPVTADDFIYWFDRGVGTESGGLFNIDTGKIEAWEKTGPQQVRLTFSDKSPYFFYLFRDQSQAPYDSVAIKENATDDDTWAARWLAGNDAGSGEYMVESWTPGQQMTLCATPDYWAGEPFFKRVVLRFIPSESDRVLLLSQGEVDIAQTLSVDALNNIREMPGINVISEPTRNQILMGLNNQVEPFDNKLVRQALSYAVPYEAIIQDVYNGQAQLSKGPIPVGGQYFDESLWPYTTDLERARALLEEAGYPDGFSFQTHIATGDASIEQLAVFLQTAFSEIGLDMQIQQDTPAVFAEGQDARTQQSWIRDLLWYVDDPGYTASAFFTPGCCNWASYESEEINELTAQMSVLTNEGADREAKAPLAQEYQRILNDDAPVLYLAQTNFQLATRDDITGYQQGPDNILWYFPLARS